MTALTVTGIVTRGYQDAQKLARGASLTADQLSDGLDRLNDLINLWQTQGLKLFLQTEISSSALVAGKQTYSMMTGGDINITKPLRIDSIAYWDVNNNARPLDQISQNDWNILSGRTQLGSVNQYFVDKLYDRLNLSLWQVPDAIAATGSLKIVVRNQAANYVNANDAITFPIEWAIALRWGVADEVSGGMPEAVQQRCQSRAQAYRAALEDWDVEDAEITFQPDSRYLVGSRFR